MESDALNGNHFVLDFADMGPIQDWVNTSLDHRHLNDVMDIPPTCENIAAWALTSWMNVYPMLKLVRVSESPNTYGEATL